MSDSTLRVRLRAIKGGLARILSRLNPWRPARLGPRYTGTVNSLIAVYQADPDSRFHQCRHSTRGNYRSLMRRIAADCGEMKIRKLHARDMLRLHEQWTAGGHVPMGHALVGMFRTLVSFGAGMLEDKACTELSAVLHRMRFKVGRPRTEHLTADHAEALRARARKAGMRSIALAQALQFDLMLRQKDVIGEWTPVGEPIASDVVEAGRKWIRSMRWEEVDSAFILRHITSKKLKPVDVPLLLAPMVVDELCRIARVTNVKKLKRSRFPTKGPIVVCESTGRPWRPSEFRRNWRELARACDIPDYVKSMDSRAGGISEATDAGADLELVRHAATHSDISMTQRYSRNAVEKTAEVMRKRAQHRAKRKPKGKIDRLLSAKIVALKPTRRKRKKQAVDKLMSAKIVAMKPAKGRQRRASRPKARREKAHAA